MAKKNSDDDSDVHPIDRLIAWLQQHPSQRVRRGIYRFASFEDANNADAESNSTGSDPDSGTVRRGPTG